MKRARKLNQTTCLVELFTLEDKVQIMSKKGKLRNHKSKRIFINDDMSKEERIIEGKLREKAKSERALGKTVKQGFHKLIIDGQVWKWAKAEDKLIRVDAQDPKK